MKRLSGAWPVQLTARRAAMGHTVLAAWLSVWSGGPLVQPSLAWLSSRSVVCCGAWATALTVAAQAPSLSAPSDAAAPAADPSLTTLIEQLGADDFQLREEAAAQLRGQGLNSFDALTNALQHPETEIQLRAQSLRNELFIRRGAPDDPPALQLVLQDYADQTVADRKERIDQLQDRGTPADCRALCRIARAEESELLSKTAALAALAISVDKPTVEDGKLDPQVLLQELGNSERSAPQWLRQRFQATGASPERWQEVVQQERANFESGSPSSDAEIVDRLTAWLIRLFVQDDHEERVLPFLQDTYQEAGISNERLVEVVDILLEAQSWPTLDQIHDAFPKEFEQSHELLYRYAESWVQRGDTARGEELANTAFGQSDRAALDRLAAAQNLESRGLFAWSEREYRQFIREVGLKSDRGIIAAYYLAEMLHDQTEDLRAAEVLQTVVDQVERDENVRKLIDDLDFITYDSLLSRREYLYAEHYRVQGNREKQLHHLVQGTQFDSTDADLLIGRYRFEGATEDFRRETEVLIRVAADKFRGQALALEQQLNRFRMWRDYASRTLAQQYNQMAWLVSNTTGDYQEALAASRKSLELVPDSAGYLDTLARCYYAVGDLDEAIATQQQALRRDPHSGQLHRQLAFFEAARQAQPANTPGANKPEDDTPEDNQPADNQPADNAPGTNTQEANTPQAEQQPAKTEAEQSP